MRRPRHFQRVGQAFVEFSETQVSAGYELCLAALARRRITPAWSVRSTQHVERAPYMVSRTLAVSMNNLHEAMKFVTICDGSGGDDPWAATREPGQTRPSSSHRTDGNFAVTSHSRIIDGLPNPIFHNLHVMVRSEVAWRGGEGWLLIQVVATPPGHGANLSFLCSHLSILDAVRAIQVQTKAECHPDRHATIVPA